ncbi:MAG TPA: cytochrome c [Lichenihabitans sp.]|jgi:cytochrome c556|nr:cytochrome c [Lichenihabitans sp.]
MTRSMITSSRIHAMGALVAASAGLWLALGSGPADAESFKSAMNDMGRTVKVAKAALASSDATKAEEALRAFAGEARTAMALVPGGGGKARDFRQRFTTLSTTAEAADPAHFRAAFGEIVNQCRSCHSVYK